MKISSDYPFDNRAAIYGDGCFTTAAIENGEVELLEYHLSRLEKACQQLNITISQDSLGSLENKLVEQAKAKGFGVLKVLISAGRGGRGYRRDDNSETEAFLQVLEPVSHYNKWRKNGISLRQSRKSLAINEELSGIKHLNRLEQVLLREQQLYEADAIVCDSQHMLVESLAGNLFWYAYGRWFTPDMSKCGVSGVMRNYILNSAKKGDVPVTIVRANIDALFSASEVFICNSLMKIVPVNQIVDVQGNQLIEFSGQAKIKEIVQLISNRVTYHL